MTPEIEEFAKVLVEWIRDASIRGSDVIVRPTANAPVAKRWRREAREETATEFARVIIPDVVDSTIFYLLYAIDEGLRKLTFTASSGVAVDLTEQGLSELAGWYMGIGGWRAMYSKERVVDDFADLRSDDS